MLCIKRLFFVCVIFSSVNSGCIISINKDLSAPQPLVLKLNPSQDENPFYLPSIGDIITLSNNQIVLIACPHGLIRVEDVSIDVETSKAICKDGKFEINDKTTIFQHITCDKLPKASALLTGKSCLENYQEIEIGFEIDWITKFLKLLTICFDPNRETTLYSTFQLSKSIAGFQVGFERPREWILGEFYSVEIDKLYPRNTQRATINDVVGLDQNSYKYVAESGEFYLTRGHLTAKADFVYGSQQWATFFYVNSAPQWFGFNDGTWNNLEQLVRSFVSENQMDLTVYTGTHQVLTLPHEKTGEEVEIFLHPEKIPVPKFFWKVLYELSKKTGVALIGINNPHVKKLKETDLICEDICDQLAWYSWDRKNFTLGYGYCCEVEDFRKSVKTLPDFEVTGLLGSGSKSHRLTLPITMILLCILS